MPETSDYEPAPWSGDSFASARATYDAHVGRSYDDAKSKGLTATDLVPERLTTDSKTPVVILCDQTGSMGTWPATIFSKLGYLDHEAKFYFGEDYAIAFGAFGDAHNGERYPVQMRPFAKEAELQERLKELVIEALGGHGLSESAELPALYALHNIDTPKAIRPILIIITDEKCYDVISPDTASTYCKVTMEQRITAKSLFDALKQKWSVYLIRKPYGRASANDEDDTNRSVRLFWENLVGTDHIAFLPDANRVVDVIFGIFAQESGKVDEFHKELLDRQLKDAGGAKKVETALKALVTIHRSPETDPAKLLAHKSVKALAPPRDKSVTRRTPSVGTRKLSDE